MNVFFIGGYFDSAFEKTVINKSKTSADIAGNRFQEAFIKGFCKNSDIQNFHIISVPFINTWPKGYTDLYFRGYSKNLNQNVNIKYLSFINIWAIRNFFRTLSLILCLIRYSFLPNEDNYFVIYCAHTPYLKAVNFLKKIHPSIKTCLIVGDLPQYMNLNIKKTYIYRVLKKIDLLIFNKECKKIDSFVVVTEQMKEALKINMRPSLVIEGIYSKKNEYVESKNILKQKLGLQESIKYIVYTGKLEINFGCVNLANAFQLIHRNDVRLIFCGKGDAVSDLIKISNNDKRICLLGQVDSQTATNLCCIADVLVNPRPNIGEYTKYSFPSKTIEYLATGNPVVAYYLDGMPTIYKDLLYVPKSNSAKDLSDTINMALDSSMKDVKMKSMKALEYLSKKRNPEYVASLIIQMLNSI